MYGSLHQHRREPADGPRLTCALALAALAACAATLTLGCGGSSASSSTVQSPTPTGDSGGVTARQTAAYYASEGGETVGLGHPTGTQTGAATAALPDLATLTSISLGPLAGDVIDSARHAIKNPYNGNPAAINTGGQLFIHMNCASCHGFLGGGGMGPALADEYWRFGGDDADIFNSIYWGRGQGMPSWKDALTEDDIWKIVAYIRTLPDSAKAHGPTTGKGQARGQPIQPNENAPAYEDYREPLKGDQETAP